MNEESNNSEHQITVDKPEKDPRRIEAGKKLAAFNKMVKKEKNQGTNLKNLNTTKKVLVKITRKK